MSVATATILDLLGRLRDARIDYQLRQNRDDAICIEVAVPGERWEIDVFEDGQLEIELYRSEGTIHDESKLDDLFLRFTD